MKSIEKLFFCALVGCLLLSKPVFAEQTDLAVKVKSCSKINDSQARLSCFDELSNKPSKTVQAELTTQQEDAFAKGHVKKTDEELAKEINSITLTISKVSKALRGELKITFSNGQKWLQKDGHKMKLKVGETVTLQKGALGSVYLKKANSKKRIKVKRLK